MRSQVGATLSLVGAALAAVRMHVSYYSNRMPSNHGEVRSVRDYV